MKQIVKPIPQFKTEEEERKFWDTHEASDYFDISRSVLNPIFPNLKPSTKTMTIRVPESLLNRLKASANKKDVPYQSLVKIILDRVLKEEH